MAIKTRLVNVRMIIHIRRARRPVDPIAEEKGVERQGGGCERRGCAVVRCEGSEKEKTLRRKKGKESTPQHLNTANPVTMCFNEPFYLAESCGWEGEIDSILGLDRGLDSK